MRSNLGLLRHLKGIVDLDSQVADRTFQLCVSEPQLHRSKVLRLWRDDLDERRATNKMRMSR